MTAIETRLTGKQANLAAITRFVNRHLSQAALQRVELRYSTQSGEPLAPHLAKDAICNLLREHGQGAAAVSVRAHEGPIDDATGEHVLRLFPVERRPAQAETVAPQDRPRGLRAWLARLFPRWFRMPAAEAAAAHSPVQAEPAITRPMAAKRLRDAVAQATAYVETDTGTAIVGGHSAPAQQVAEARVIVRLASLHAVLGPMVTGNAAAAAQSLGAMIQAQRLALAPGFAVSYAFKPRQSGDGTGYATESDVQVRLIVARAGSPVAARPGASPRVEPTLGESSVRAAPPVASGTLTPAKSTEQTAAAGGTALPPPGVRPGPVLTIRVLGTLSEAFAQPFEMRFSGLPVRFDRAALEQAGFGQAHPGLLAVASNSCPLHVRQGEQGDLGMLQLHVSTRASPGGVDTPMYFSRDTLAGLKGQHTLPRGGQQIVVNAPGGVQDPATGSLLPALVIEVLAGAAGG